VLRIHVCVCARISTAAWCATIARRRARRGFLAIDRGSFSIVPIDTWGSGDFDALADSLFGYDTPRLNQLSLDMEQTACTT